MHCTKYVAPQPRVTYLQSCMPPFLQFATFVRLLELEIYFWKMLCCSLIFGPSNNVCCLTLTAQAICILGEESPSIHFLIYSWMMSGEDTGTWSKNRRINRISFGLWSLEVGSVHNILIREYLVLYKAKFLLVPILTKICVFSIQRAKISSFKCFLMCPFQTFPCTRHFPICQKSCNNIVFPRRYVPPFGVYVCLYIMQMMCSYWFL